MSGACSCEKPEVLGNLVFLIFPENSFFLMLLQAVSVNTVTSAASFLSELLPQACSQPASWEIREPSFQQACISWLDFFGLTRYTSSKKLTQVVFFWFLKHGKFPGGFPHDWTPVQLPVLLLLQWSLSQWTITAEGLRRAGEGLVQGTDADKHTMWSYKPPFLRKLIRAWTKQPEAVFPVWVCREVFSIYCVGFGDFCSPIRDADIRGVPAFQPFTGLEGFPEVI